MADLFTGASQARDALARPFQLNARPSKDLRLGDLILTDGELHQVVGIVFTDVHIEPPGFPSYRKTFDLNGPDLWAVITDE